MCESHDLAGTVCRSLVRRFAEAGLDSPRLEAELVMARAMGCDRLSVRIHPERRLTPAELESIEHMAGRRAAGEPAAYVLGEREFYGRVFAVRPGTLVPRPETELLVDTALERVPPKPGKRVLDLCSGSGCVGITLKLERPGWQVCLMELMEQPLAVSLENAHSLGAAVAVARADLHRLPLAAASLDLLVANPPYVACREIAEVDRNVLKFEPAVALFAGADGMDAIRHIIRQACALLAPDGILALEHGWRQGAAVRSAMRDAGFREIFTKKDLSGLDRVTSARI